MSISRPAAKYVIESRVTSDPRSLGMCTFSEPVSHFATPIVKFVLLPEPGSFGKSCDVFHREQDCRLLAGRAFSAFEDHVEIEFEFWLCIGRWYRVYNDGTKPLGR